MGRIESICRVVLTLVCLAVSQPAGAGEAVAARRLALVVGANDGGRDRVRLQYADSDAQAMTKVLSGLGYVASADQVTLRDPDARELRQGLARIQGMLESAKRSAGRVELVFYYSGHSNEEALLLRGERFSYQELRSALQALPSDVRIVILDSCSSGMFTRSKGGSFRPPFLVDQSSQVAGQVILTSSSANEASQESDRIGGSFFTHNLISGLRGAADVTHDGRVTLTEAYQFAFQQTLARTESTQGGAQHPSYAIELVGTGDVVMTDLRGTQAGLMLPASLEGRLYVRDGGGNLVVEIEKHAGAAMDLGLEAGRYAILVDRGGQRLRGEVELKDGSRTELSMDALVAVQSEPTAMRGDNDRRDWVTVPVSFDIAPGIGSSGLMTRTVENNVSLGLLGNHSGRLNGFGFTPGVSVVYQDGRGVQIGGLANVVGERVRGLQFSLGANVAGEVPTGLQLAGLANVSRGPLSGGQLSLLGNYSPTINGFQVGLINIGGDVSGAQVGFLNVANRVKGLQLGVLNFANDPEGIHIGVLTLLRNGRYHFEAWGSETSSFNIGAKLGTEQVYSLIGFGSGLQTRRLETTLGIGGRIPVGSVFFDLELAAASLRPFDSTDTKNYVMGRARASVGYRFFPWLAVYGGGSANGFIPIDPNNLWDDVGTGPHLDTPVGSRFIRFFPGFFAGVEIL